LDSLRLQINLVESKLHWVEIRAGKPSLVLIERHADPPTLLLGPCPTNEWKRREIGLVVSDDSPVDGELGVREVKAFTTK
jgi:hypothetical protein